jgi:ABC-type transport system involved in cytochrome c biogenesis ATPase subunit
MRLNSIHIENFRCFERVDLPLEKITTLVGENGAGKSALLEAISFAVSPNVAASRVSEQDFNNADAGDIVIEANLDERFIAKVADGYTTQSIQCSGVRLEVKRREKAAAGKALCDGYVISHYCLPDDSVQRTPGGWTLKRQSGSDFNFSKRHLCFPVDTSGFLRCFYLDKERDRHLRTGFSTTLERLAEEFNWRFRKSLDANKQEYLRQWEEFYSLIMRGVDDKKLAGTLDAVKGSVKQFLGDKFGDVELSLLNLEQPFTKSFFAIRDGCNQVEQSGLGSGISMILAYFLQETISSLSNEPLIFLVDEPELHLHPQLQRRLRKHFQDGDSQVILATHSEMMLNLADWQSIKRIDSKRQCNPTAARLETSPPHDGSRTYRARLDEIAATHKDERIYLRENNEILFADICVLVEGPIDRYGLRVLGTRSGFDLSRVTFICCHGKEKIAAYELLCRVFEIPFFVFLDLDGVSETEGTNADVIGFAGPSAYYAFRPSFEALFAVTQRRKTVAALAAIDSCTATPKQVTEGLEHLSAFVELH